MSRPVILIAFSNDLEGQFLREIAEEQKKIRQVFEGLIQKNLVELHVLTNVTADNIFDAFIRFGNRIKVFHYAGHAKDFGLLLKESKRLLNVKGLAPFLASQKGLKVVFMNACSTSIQQSVFFEAGIPELILTKTPISDERAVGFAHLFYKSLAAGKTVSDSYANAKHFTTAIFEGEKRELIFPPDQHSDPEVEFPWELHQLHPENSFSLQVKPSRLIYVIAAIILIVVSLGIGYQLRPLPFDLTLKLNHLSGQAFELDRDIRSVFFIWNDTRYQGEISHEGTVFFHKLPPNIKRNEIHLQLESEVWTFKDSLFLANDAPNLSAMIQPKEAWISGTVTNDVGTFLEGVKVFVAKDDASVWTNEKGYFHLKVPLSLLPSKNILLYFQKKDSSIVSYYTNPYSIQDQGFMLEG